MMTDNEMLVKEIEDHDKLQRKILLIKSVALLLSILIALIGATVAWFANVSEVSAHGMSVKAEQPQATNFVIGQDDNYPRNITFPCAIDFADYSPDYASDDDISDLIEDGIVYIAGYKVEPKANSGTSAYIKIDNDYAYLKVMYLLQVNYADSEDYSDPNAPVFKPYLADWIRYLNDDSDNYETITTSVEALHFTSITGTGCQISTTQSQMIYVAFYVDYDAEYSTGVTLGEAIKNGTVSNLSFDIDFLISDNPFTS